MKYRFTVTIYKNGVKRIELNFISDSFISAIGETAGIRLKDESLYIQRFPLTKKEIVSYKKNTT